MTTINAMLLSFINIKILLIDTHTTADVNHTLFSVFDWSFPFHYYIGQFRIISSKRSDLKDIVVVYTVKIVLVR